MPANAALLKWLEDAIEQYSPDLVAVFRKEGPATVWPLTAADPDDLVGKLEAGGHFVALPKEPAALANVLEVSLVDFIIDLAGRSVGVEVQRGTERGYPDIEVSGEAFGGGHHAVDVKVARRNKTGSATQSRITLYTGNTYFRYPSLRWPGSFRPFEDYDSHVDLIVLYTLDEESLGRVTDPEILVREPWRIASKQRSSTTREYLGAVQRLDDLRDSNGEFATEADFYKYWRAFKFKIGPSVQQQLDKLLVHGKPSP